MEMKRNCEALNGVQYLRADMRPDRSMTDFYCKICDAHMYSEQTWEAHVVGKRHLKNVTKAPGEMPSKVRSLRISKRAWLMDVVKDIREPVVGLGYMTELQRVDPYLKPSYTCHLCQANLTWSVVIDHILDTKHRLAYIKAVDHSRHEQMVSLQLSKENFDVLVADQAETFEKERGQGSMVVKLEKPKMVLPPPRQAKSNSAPARWSPSFSSRSSVRSEASLKRPSSRTLCRSQSRSPAHRSRYRSPCKLSFRHHTSHKEKRYTSPERYNSHQLRSPSSRSSHASTSRSSRASTSSSFELPDIENFAKHERIKLLNKLKLARLIVKGKLSKLRTKVDPSLREIFD